MVLPRKDTGAANDKGENEDEGWLVDFDYGGKANIVTYPEGYKRVLADGNRPGKADKNITIMDDWQSLFQLIFYRYRHTFLPKGENDPLADAYKTKVTNVRETIESYYSSDPESNIYKISDYKSPATLLRDYLDLVSTGYTIEPIPSFKEDMIDCGLWNNPASNRKMHLELQRVARKMDN